MDNRLTFLLGLLAKRYPDALYVHLTRDPDETAASWARRFTDHPPSNWIRRRLTLYPRPRLIHAWAYGILERRDPWPEDQHLALCRQQVDATNAAIRDFLRDRPHVTVKLEAARGDFTSFWEWAGLDGDLDAALSEWGVRHNAS